MARPEANLRQFEEEIIRLHQVDHWSLEMIARQYHVSRTAIHKMLRAKGVDTSKAASWVSTQCAYCEAPLTVRRATYRRIKHHFCHQDHYTDWLKISGYIPNRSGQRRGRGTVESIYGPLPAGSVVHHKDGNCFNNFPSNLMLFSGHGDHVKWHRDKREGVTPLWSG